MTWSEKQRKIFLSASNKAGWNAQQRYMVMRYCGCPESMEKKRPTVSNPLNNNRHFGECMAVAESQCAARHVKLFPPSGSSSWAEALHDTRSAQMHLARKIVAEAVKRMPAKFSDGLMSYTIDHVTKLKPNPLAPESRPDRIEDCDGPTVHRVVESLKAHVGRVFEAAGITPWTFDTTEPVRERGYAERTRRSA